jgi:hypothetical protein
MDAPTLGIAMKHICRYYGKQQPKDETLDEWYRELSNIPSECMPWIEQKIKANEYPNNPPQAIRKLWFQWLNEHPNRKDHKEEGPRHPDPNHWTNWPTEQIKQMPEYKIGKALLSGGGWEALADKFKPEYEDDIPF